MGQLDIKYKTSKTGKSKDIGYHYRKILKLQDLKQKHIEDLISNYGVHKKSNEGVTDKEEDLSNEINQEKSGIIARYSLFPISDEKTYAFAKRQEIQHWSSIEINYTDDIPDYNSIKKQPGKKRLVDLVNAFFSVGDGLISQNVLRFLLECPNYEKSMFYIYQLHIEAIHAETYGMILYTLSENEEELKTLLNFVKETPSLKAKTNFMEKWIFSDKPKSQRLLANACMEGIFFCNNFMPIFWFNSKGMFPAMGEANNLINGDESLHRETYCNFYLDALDEEIEDELKAAIERHPRKDPLKIKKNIIRRHQKIAKEIVSEALAVEDLFVDDLLPEPVEDLNAADMKIYARLIVDNLYAEINMKQLYHVKNPFTWMESISLYRKNNFYEKKRNRYTSTDLANALDWKKRAGKVLVNQDHLVRPEDVDF